MLHLVSVVFLPFHYLYFRVCPCHSWVRSWQHWPILLCVCCSYWLALLSHSLATSLLPYFWFQAIIHNAVWWCGPIWHFQIVDVMKGKGSAPTSVKYLQIFSQLHEGVTKPGNICGWTEQIFVSVTNARQVGRRALQDSSGKGGREEIQIQLLYECTIFLGMHGFSMAFPVF